MKLGVPDLVTNSYFPAIAAVELGFFANEGLDVDIELSYPQTMDALRDGEIELAADCAHATLEAFPNWRGAKLLMALSQEMYWLLIMRTDLNIEPGDLQALKGRRIGAGPGVDLVLHHLLRVVRGIAHFGLVVDDIADRPQINFLAGFAVVNVFFLGFTETFGEGELGVVSHGLVGKTQEGVGVDGVMNLFYDGLGKGFRQVDTGDTGTEVRVERVDKKLGHSDSRGGLRPAKR